MSAVNDYTRTRCIDTIPELDTVPELDTLPFLPLLCESNKYGISIIIHTIIISPDIISPILFSKNYTFTAKPFINNSL